MGTAGTGNAENEMTLRLGVSFSVIEQWAIENSYHAELLLSYHLLGLDQHTVAVANLTAELAKPETQAILADWQDSKIAHQLLDFSRAFVDSDIYRGHTALVFEGSNRKIKEAIGDTTDRKFLLYLLVTSSPNFSHSKNSEYCRQNHQKLIIWIILQAAERLIGEKHAPDRFVSDAARFLARESSNTSWQAICPFLDEVHKLTRGGPVSYQQFTDAIAIASDTLPEKIRKRATHFFNVLGRLAGGGVDAISTQRALDSPEIPGFEGLLASSPVEPESAVNLENALSQTFTPLEASADGEDDGSHVSFTEVVLDVDPTDTAVEHAISSKSFHLLTQEDANYLPWALSGVLPPEQPILREWIANQLTSLETENRLGAAIVDIAQICSRSLYYTQAFKITDIAGQEWSLSEDLKYLIRLAPRRPGSWEPREHQLKFIAPFQRLMRIKLPEGSATALKKAMPRTGTAPKTLYELWSLHSSEKHEKWFNQTKPELLSRVLTKMPSRLASQRTFDVSGDQNLARLFSAEPNSGLPASCAYGYTSAAELQRILKPAGTDIASSIDAATNVMGSRLVMTQDYIDDWVEHIRTNMRCAPEQGFIAFHNQVATFCVTALYAATGCRHCSDPFESLAHFDLVRGLVYINDKSDSGLHDGRITPIPAAICSLVEQYTEYIKAISSQIKGSQPAFAAQLSLLSHGKPAELPFFFLLDNNWSWCSPTVLESTLPGLPLAIWDLKENQFRHRYQQELVRRGVEQEVVEAWVGHAESGATTYSDSSPRCWMTDMDQFRPIVDELYSELGLPESLPSIPIDRLQKCLPNFAILIRHSKFGVSRREEERKRKRSQAIRDANRDINLFLRKRKMAELDKNEVEKLSRLMLHGNRSTRAPFASTRLEVLNRKIMKEGDPKKRVISKVVVSMQPEISHLRHGSIRALTSYPEIRAWAFTTLKAASHSRLSRPNSALAGSILLCILKRISYQKLLEDVASGENYRILIHGKRYFFEYSEKLDPHDFTTPIQRHEINYKLASILQKGYQHSQKPKVLSSVLMDTAKHISLDQLPIPLEDNTTAAEFISTIGEIVNQYNLVTLPGIVAGALSARQPPCSAPIQDLLRITEGVRIIPTSSTLSIDEEMPQEVPDINIIPIGTDKKESQENSEIYLKEVYTVLKRYEPNILSARKVSREVMEITDANTRKVSSSVLMLGHWISYRILQGKGYGKNFKALMPDSITNYFSTLRKSFSGILYQTNLLDLDEDEITDSYYEMIQYVRNETSNKNGKTRKEVTVKYFCDQLVHFHRWASRYGLEDPDWDELDMDCSARSVRPGLVSERDYLKALSHLHGSQGWHNQDNLFIGFVLFLTYRFGLRSKEARFLRRKDWNQLGGSVWVLVANNRKRRLKSLLSRRAVPLLFDLDEIEHKLIEMMLSHYDSVSGAADNAYLLCEIIEGKPQLSPHQENIPRKIIKLLRSVTGSNRLVLHDCRHGFYNVCFAALYRENSPLSDSLVQGLSLSKIQEMVLGPQHGHSRRCGMALARLMGHADPGCGLKSYNHLITDLCDSLVPLESERCHPLVGAFNTADFKVATSDQPKPELKITAYAKPTLENILKALRLVGQGRSYEKAGQLVGLPPFFCKRLEGLLSDATHSMRFKRRAYDWQTESINRDWVFGREVPGSLLYFINESAWSRLIFYSKNISICDTFKFPVLDYDELVEMFGNRRQILILSRGQCQFAKQVLSSLNVPRAQYYAASTRNDSRYLDIFRNFDIPIVKVKTEAEEGMDIKFDPYPNRQIKGQFWNIHGSIIFKPNHDGFLRNSHEFALAFISVTALICLSRS